MNDTGGWFGPQDGALFGWFCMPDSGTATSGVLLCPPVGEEEHNAHETYRQLAHRLAERGIASLRFDYHGVGDSSGLWSEPGRVPAWLDSVGVAAQTMRDAGLQNLSAVGMRVGAALAGTAAYQQLLELDALVLWDPCGGREMLREGKARRPSPLAPPAGAVDTPGYLYSAETVAALEQLDVAKLGEGALARRVLVLTRPERPTPKALKNRLAAADVEWGFAHGQPELLDVPMTDSILPEQSMGQIIDYLSTHSGPPQAVMVPLAPELELTTISGRIFRERVTSLGSIGLFGILSEPAQQRAGPLIIFVNVANDRHTGPGRRWVDASRAWADYGFTVLRIDQSGTGDSPSHPGQDFGTMYSRHWLEDMPEALASELLRGHRLVLVGLCSGAYTAMESTFVLPIDAVYAINVVLHAKVTGRHGAQADARRRVAKPPTKPFIALSRRWLIPGNIAWRLYRQLAVWHAPAASVSSIIKRGTRVILIMSPNDGRHFRESAFWAVTHFRRWSRSGRLKILVDPAVDHPLMTQEGQIWTMQAIEKDLLAHYR